MTTRIMEQATSLDPPDGIVSPIVMDHTYEPCLRGIEVLGTAGLVNVTCADGSSGPIYMPAGSRKSMSIVKVNTSGTSAALLTAGPSSTVGIVGLR